MKKILKTIVLFGTLYCKEHCVCVILQRYKVNNLLLYCQKRVINNLIMKR